MAGVIWRMSLEVLFQKGDKSENELLVCPRPLCPILVFILGEEMKE